MLEIKWSSHLTSPELNGALCNYVSERIWGKPKPFPLSTCIGIFDDQKLIGAAVYYEYEKDAGVIQISGASDTPRWLNRRVLNEMFKFPFEELKCQAIVMRVSKDHSRLARMLPSYGFVVYEIPRLRGRDEPEMIYVLYDDVWRKNGFHKERSDGQESSRPYTP